ncbi:MAG: transcription antitermination factor NusB [Bacteroidetes bacterium]|nr:transcription antitermination factor NusB [Bacteroidota bacterium]
MIKRRSVRIKVFQAVYGFEHGDGQPLKQFSNTLKERIRSVTTIYLYNFHIIHAFAGMVQHEADNIAGKHIKTSEDKAFNTKLLSNVLIQLLENNETYKEAVETHEFEELIDEALLQNWYRDFKESDEYNKYLESSANFDSKEDLALIRFLFKDFLLEREDFHEHMDELWSNWIDDAGFISTSLLQSLEKSKNKLSLACEKENYNAKIKELEDFGDNLLRSTINDKEQQIKLVESKLKNWDIERLASTDVLILRMAIAELTNFPSIPTKVTINEYIDIAKEYSTPKSKEFINGILDNLTKELKEKGIILKEGRGLKES